MEIVKFWKWRLSKWIAENWERVLFSLFGLVLIGAAFRFVYLENITGAAAIFGLGFLSFIYANVSRFKKFKGLGFEAELWEDKKKEAASLIEQLRSIVTIYSRELLNSRVAGRRFSKVDWKDDWALYEDLINRHKELGQLVDLSAEKTMMDDYFLFDICSKESEPVRHAINDCKRAARAKITELAQASTVHGPIYNDMEAIVAGLKESVDDSFTVCQKGNLGTAYLQLVTTAKERVKQGIGVEWDAPVELLEKLKQLEAICAARPVAVRPELIAMANY